MVKPGKLLLVENDQPVRDALMRVLAGENYDVIAVFDPEQAIEAFKTNNIDIVILDLNLADLDGGAVLATLKQTSGGPRAKIGGPTRPMYLAAWDPSFWASELRCRRSFLHRLRFDLKPPIKIVPRRSLERAPQKHRNTETET